MKARPDANIKIVALTEDALSEFSGEGVLSEFSVK